MTAWTLLIIAALTVIGFFAGRMRAQNLRVAGADRLHSLPAYHGLLLASMGFATAAVTALVFTLGGGANSFAMPLRGGSFGHSGNCRDLSQKSRKASAHATCLNASSRSFSLQAPALPFSPPLALCFPFSSKRLLSSAKCRPLNSCLARTGRQLQRRRHSDLFRFSSEHFSLR